MTLSSVFSIQKLCGTLATVACLGVAIFAWSKWSGSAAIAGIFIGGFLPAMVTSLLVDGASAIWMKAAKTEEKKEVEGAMRMLQMGLEDDEPVPTSFASAMVATSLLALILQPLAVYGVLLLIFG